MGWMQRPAVAAWLSGYTYGCAVVMPWEAGVDSPLRMFCDSDQQMMCRGRFAPVVHRMDPVAAQELVTIVVEPAFADSVEVTVQLFRTRAPDPRYVDDEGCELAAELTIDVSDTVGQAERPIAVQLYLGCSPIQVEVHSLTTNKESGCMHLAGGRVMDVRVLAGQLRQLKSQLLSEATEPEQLHDVADIESAMRAAEAGDELAVRKHLRAAGQWPLDVAADRGMGPAADALRAAQSLPG